MNFPTANALQPMFGGGFSDAFVAKLNADGRTFVYSTYLGGNNSDAGFGIAVDASGNAYATGFTQSSNFPTTRNALQPAFGGNLSTGLMGFGGDAFVTKFNPNGRRFVYSTHLGGKADEAGGRIIVDDDGNAYVTGATSSPDFPTANALQPVLGGSLAFKSTDGGSTWSAISNGLMGTGVKALVIDPTIRSTLYAGTNSSGVFKSTDGGSHWNATSLISRVDALTIDPATPTTVYAGTAIGADAFVTKLNANGSVLVFSTYLGGSNTDFGIGIAVDAGGNVYVTGATFSINFPIMNPVQMALGGSSDAFVVKLAAENGSP